MSSSLPDQRSSPFRPGFLVAVALATGLTVVFWRPLWTGGGLIGGDIYYYFLPQKVAYSEALLAGEWPLWNDRVGFGYPTVGESQTGVFYPPNLLLYRWLSVDRAYSVSMLAHYVLAFVGAWLFSRRLGLDPTGAILAATVYTYGWFPCRISLEWAIIGGAWLPLALWLTESFLQSGRWRFVFFLSAVLAVQMSAGHFTLAFITQLTIGGWWLLRCLIATRRERVPPGRWAGIPLAVVFGFALAAGQLWPTWELKQLSQRQTVTDEHDPGYGYLPPLYLLQAAAPWHWYADDDVNGDGRPDAGSRFRTTMISGWPRTNRVEAHLYFGLLPLLLSAAGLTAAWRNGKSPAAASPAPSQGTKLTLSRRGLALMCLAAGGTTAVYATGCLIPLFKHLPGFSFFEGPGRYGIVTTLAVAVLAGSGLDGMLSRLSKASRQLVAIVVLAITVFDLWVVSRSVGDAVLVERPPIRQLPGSELRRRFTSQASPVRLLSPAKNAASILGVSVWPPYLGLAPAAYSDPARKMPEPLPFKSRPTPEQLDWLRRAGVTHLLVLEDMDLSQWREADGTPALSFVGRFFDPVLNPVLATDGPLRVYAVERTRGRAAYEGIGTVLVLKHSPMAIQLEANGQGGTVILTELMSPGWQVRVDGQPAEPIEVEGVFRGVTVPAGKHAVFWTYAPASVLGGGIVSGVTILVWLAMGHVWFWHRRCW